MKRSYYIALIIFFIAGVFLVLHEYRANQSTEIIDPNLYTIVPGVGIGSVKFNMTKEEIIEHFGEPDEVTDNGMSLMYKSKGFTLGVYSVSGLRNINCYTKIVTPPFTFAEDFPGSTDKGISMGAGRADIVAAYGPPDKVTTNEKQINLTYDELGIEFILLKDELVQFFMSPVKAEVEN